MTSILKKMYSHSENILSDWMEKLFPDIFEGCINFGYWKNIRKPLTIQKRIASQKNLYFEVFKHFSSDFKEILEVGCGRGHGVFWLRENGYEAYGIDVLQSQIAKSIKNYPNFSRYLKCGNAEAIPFKDANFDCIYSIEAAQHFSSFDNFCKESFRVLKNNGRLLISTYFFCENEFAREIKRIIPNNIEGFHNTLVISDALKLLEKNNFLIKKLPIAIGNEIFPFYSLWQKQQLGDTRLSDLSKKQTKWKDYYTGGGNSEHPWLRAFKKGWLDYFILEAVKINK